MRRLVSIASLGLACCVSARADYLSDRKAALELVRGGTNEAALALFVTMAAGPYTDFQKSDALEQAATIAQRLKRDAEAMELARRIPLAPASKTMQMRLMDATRKWRELVDAFKDEAIDAWPEDVAGDAFFLRGHAYYRIGNGKGAEADLTKAIAYKPGSGWALNLLGDTYASLLKDDERALATYRRGYQNESHKAADSVGGVMQILVRQNGLDEALAELGTIAADKNAGKGDSRFWRGFMLSSQGNLLAKQGRKAEAMARYRDATEVEGLAPAQKAGYEKVLKELEAGDK